MRGCVLAVLARPRGLEGVIDASKIRGYPMSKWFNTGSLRLGSGSHGRRSPWAKSGNERMQSEGWVEPEG